MKADSNVAPASPSICIDLTSYGVNPCEHDLSPTRYANELPVDGIRRVVPPPLGGGKSTNSGEHDQFVWRRCHKCKMEVVFENASEEQDNSNEDMALPVIPECDVELESSDEEIPCEHDLSPTRYADELSVDGTRRVVPPLVGGGKEKNSGEPEFIWRRCRKCAIEVVFDAASE